MQLVGDKYYIWYNRVASGFAGLVLILGTGSIYIQSLEGLKAWGVSQPLVLLLSAFQLAYGVAVFRLEQRNNIWMAGMISALLSGLVLIGLIQNSGMLHSLFVVLWFVVVLAAGIFGTGTLIVSCVIATAYYFVSYTGGGQDPTDFLAIAVVLATYVAALVSYLAWKRQYYTGDNARLNQLTGELKNTHAQGELLIQSITDGVVVTDQNGKIGLFNPAAAKMTSWPVAEATGIDVELVVKLQQENGTELDDKEYPIKKVLATGEPVNEVYRIINKEPQPTIVSASVTPMLDKKQKTVGTATILRDISMARAEENRRAEFISTASHEMRTPVAAIEGYIQLAMNDKVAKIDNKARELLGKGLESTHRLGKLFQDLLTSAKAEDGRIVSHPEPIELGEYLKGLTDGFKFSAEKKGLLVDYRIGVSSQGKVDPISKAKVVKPLYYIYADPERLQEVITNLFDNAVKYTEKGKITIAVTADDKVVQFYIQDTGGGIPAADIPHLFQKFYRVDNSATRTVGGTGLGLFICKKIIDLYKGTIWVNSKQGQGSTFFINLPRLSAQQATELMKKQEQAVL